MKNHIYKALAFVWIMVLASPCFAQYNSVLGRFHQRDPLGVRPGQATFINGAPYLAGNNWPLADGGGRPETQDLTLMSSAQTMSGNTNDQAGSVVTINTSSAIVPAYQYLDGMSLYEYVKSNPLKYLDKYGFYNDKCDYCGPDTTHVMEVLKDEIDKEWNKASFIDQIDSCIKIHDPRYASGAWDIIPYFDHTITCPGCPTGPTCDHTVHINGKCYNSDAANYWLWGYMHSFWKCQGAGTGYIAMVYWKRSRYHHAPDRETISWYWNGVFGDLNADSTHSDCVDCQVSWVPRLPWRWLKIHWE